MALTDIFKKAWSSLTPKRNIEKQLNVSVATSGTMENAIELWSQMYKNEPPWRGGNANVIPLNLPAAISEELARLILTEFKIEITGSARADFMNKIVSGFLPNLSNHVELYCAMGAICMKPYRSGDTIKIDFTEADRFYPTAYDTNKEITGGVFVDSKLQGDYIYTRMESHNLVGTDYTIVNTAFRSERLYLEQFGDDDPIRANYPFMTPVPLTEVEEWSELSEEPVVINNIERPLFVYIRVPRANNVDLKSPLGASVFSRAVDVIEQADRQFSRILWEYEATEAAVHASEELFDSDKKGKPILPKGKERLYRALDFNGKEAGSFMKEYAPEIRDNSLFSGLNKYFQRIEFLCGLSYGTISDPQQIEKTAEEIRTSKQRSFTVVSKMQESWDIGFEHLIYILDVLCTLYNLAPPGAAEKSATWGDGVLEDTEKEFQRRWAMVLAGKYKLEKFYAWYFGCSEDDAKELIPDAPKRGTPYPPEE